MHYNTLDIQARLKALNFDPGPIDGKNGPKTKAALVRAGGLKSIFTHSSGLHRIIMHWTAGASGVTEIEREHYHVIIGSDSRVYLGRLRPEANSNTSDGIYAAHTLNLNGGSIGVALDAMAHAKERPFDAGTNPITNDMLSKFYEEIATLCIVYKIPLSKWSVLTHAEVQPTLGVRQNNKWDITWLPGMTKPGDPVEVGNVLRMGIRAAINRQSATSSPVTTEETVVDHRKFLVNIYDQISNYLEDN